MARRAPGSNQYKTRLAADVLFPPLTADLLEQAVDHQLSINRIRHLAQQFDPWKVPAQPFSCSDSTMHTLLRDPSWRVRAYAVYCCEDPSDNWWSIWSQHRDYIVRSACAYREDCPEFVRFMLAKDPHHAVRASVALRSYEHPAIRRRLAEDNNPTVRAAAISPAPG